MQSRCSVRQSKIKIYSQNGFPESTFSRMFVKQVIFFIHVCQNIFFSSMFVKIFFFTHVCQLGFFFIHVCQICQFFHPCLSNLPIFSPMFVKKGGTAWFLFFFGMNFEENDDSHFFIYVYVLDKHTCAKKKIFETSCDLL